MENALRVFSNYKTPINDEQVTGSDETDDNTDSNDYDHKVEL